MKTQNKAQHMKTYTVLHRAINKKYPQFYLVVRNLIKSGYSVHAAYRAATMSN